MAELREDNEAWTESIRKQLETSARDLDGASLSRLNQARQAALQLAHKRKSPQWLGPAAWASACTLALAVALWPRLPSPPALPSAATSASAEDFPMLAGEDALDLYQDLDFYAWLDAQPASG